jgi:putative transposase
MARKPRIHFPGALYHVISRGNQGQKIFLDEKDLKTYLSYLSEYKIRYPFRLYAYVLMTNHFHLLLEVGETSLSKIMQSLLFRYTRYFNRRYGKLGHLFQGRYRAILCDKDTYLLELVRYIHLNPVRARVVSKPEEYRWSGHLRYLGRGRDDLLDQDRVLEQFSRGLSVSRRKYRAFVLEGVQGGHQERYYEVKDQRYLGEESFIERVEKEAKVSEERVYDLPVDLIAREVSKAIGIPLERLYSLSRDRKGVYGRSVVAYLARAVSGQLVKDVAQHFRRSPMTVSRGVIKFEESLRNDRRFRQRIEMVKGDLIKKGKRKYDITIA